MKMFMARQGDVFILEVSDIPTAAKEVMRDNGRVVLAYGEVTGHSHAIANPKAKLFRDDGNGGATFLSITAPTGADLHHEEHRTITVPPGNYRVVIQQEYTPEAIRNVAD